MKIKIGFYERPSIIYEDGISVNFVDQQDFIIIKRNNNIRSYFKLCDVSSVYIDKKE